MNYWLIVGTAENWEEAFQKGNVWGLKERQKHIWNNLQENDVILFYAVRPIAGVIGYGTVKTKFRQTQPLWSAEIQQNKILWPLCFEFNVEDVLPSERWHIDRITSELLRFRVGVRSRQIDACFAQEIVKRFQVSSGEPEEDSDVHQEMKERLVEIGNMQNYIAKEEYPFDMGRFDVVWRRVAQSVPTYVFEVNVKGDLYRALSKLQHAYVLWNSQIFIVASAEDIKKVKGLVSGTFHEIQDRLKFIDLEKVRELYKCKKYFKDMEKNLGL